jgi:excisionase family DNA binding protein
MLCVVMLMNEVLAYTPEEIALRLRVSEETVRREIRAKHLGALQVGKQYRVAPSDLIAYLGKQRYEEWFGPREDLKAVIGSGGLPEDEAQELAVRAVKAIRAEETVGVQPKRPPSRDTNPEALERSLTRRSPELVTKTPAKKPARRPHA